MRKTSKILALALALVMLFAFASMFTVSAASTTVRVYLDNQKNYSGTMYCYYWGGSNGPSWPGKAMSKDAATGYWYYDIPAGHSNVIFTNKNAGSWQTSDLKVPTNDNVVFNNKTNTWSQYIPPQVGHTCNWVEDKDQYVAPTCTTTGLKVENCTAEGCDTKVRTTTLSALGHNYSGTTCTRCSAVATFTVAGSGAHLGTEWDTGNKANDMTYADGVYTKVYTNVAAGSYGLKCVRDHAWDVAYGGIGNTADKDGNYKYTVDTAGSTVTVTLKGTTVDVKVEAPHVHNFVEGKCECGEEDPNYVPPHVNTLVVGETNKIVVSGNFVNEYNLPIEWVSFVADENAFYSFVGDNGALAFIFTAEGALVSATGAANLEAGAYLICVGNGLVGEFNVAVTKSAWVNVLVEGANKILITDAQDNGYGFYISWVPFEVTEKANYTFTGEGILALVYDAANGAVTGTELDVGTYNICVAFLTSATTGVATVNVEKTPIGDTPVDAPKHDGEQEFVIGENKVIIDGCTVNGAGTAVEMVKLVVTEKAKYTVTSDALNTFISTSTNPADVSSYVCNFTGIAVLEPGTYYVCCGNSGVMGEFTVVVTVEALDENCEHEWLPANCAAPKTCAKCGETEGDVDPEVHVTFFDTCTKCGKDVPTFVVGTNHVIFIKGVTLNDHYFKIYIPEGGTYVVSGGAPVKVYLWTVPTHQLEGGALTMQTPYGWNIDAMTESGFADSFEVVLPEAGVYWIAFNFDFITEDTHEFDIEVSLKPAHEHEFVDGKCECGEEDPNYVPPHEHEFVDGKCECGEKDPTWEPPVEDPKDPEPQPEPELNFFQKIIAWFMDLIQKFLAIFKK